MSKSLESMSKAEDDMKAANWARIRSLTIKIVSHLENLAGQQAKTTSQDIIKDIRSSLNDIKNITYDDIRNIVDQEVKIRLPKMRSTRQQDFFRTLWDDLANEVFGKRSKKEIPEGERPLTKTEKQTGFINSTAAEWARRIFDNYKNPGQLNFGALLSSMEREFGTMPSLPREQLEGAESSKPIINALDELKKIIEKELEKIANQSQLAAIKKEGAIKKLEDRIESYKRVLRSGKIG